MSGFDRLCVSAILLLTSCASAPPPQDLSLAWEIPHSWEESPTPGATADIDTVWWPEGGGEELDELVAQALAHNFDLRIAATRLQEAVAQARIAGAPQLPQVQLAGSGGRRRQNFVGFPISGQDAQVLSTTTNSYGVSLNLSWEIDLWGRLRAGEAAALADLMAADAEWRGARLSLVAQTARAYFAVVEARRQVELAQATLDNQRLSAQQVLVRYERGLRPSLDVRLGRSNAASAEAVLHDRRRQLDLVTRQLEILLGRYPAGTLASSSTSTLPEVSSPIPAGLPADLIGRRPDLVAAERRLAAAGARVTEAKRALYPQISLTASGGRSSGELGDLLDGDFSVWSLVGGLTQPLFQGGLLRARVELAKSQSEQALAQFAQIALRAFSEVEGSLAASTFIEDRESALEISAVEAVAARQLAEARYERGLADFITVLEAQRRAYETESQLLVVRRQRLDNRIDLHLALGGDFTQ